VSARPVPNANLNSLRPTSSKSRRTARTSRGPAKPTTTGPNIRPVRVCEKATGSRFDCRVYRSHFDNDYCPTPESPTNGEKPVLFVCCTLVFGCTFLQGKLGNEGGVGSSIRIAGLPRAVRSRPQMGIGSVGREEGSTRETRRREEWREE